MKVGDLVKHKNYGWNGIIRRVYGNSGSSCHSKLRDWVSVHWLSPTECFFREKANANGFDCHIRVLEVISESG